MVKEEISSLTGLRFLAALSVAVAHGASMVLRLDPQHAYLVDWMGRGAAFGMTLFFVLSGFVIHFNYRETVTSGGASGIASFIWARFSRLYPLFFLVLAADFLFHCYFTSELHQVDVQLRALPYHLLSIQSWLYEPIRNHSLVYTIGTAVPVTWSISTEWFFYLFFPVIAPVVRLLRRASVAAVAAVFWCVLWTALIVVVFKHLSEIEAWAVSRYGSIASSQVSFQDSYYRWLFYFSPYARIGEFILGCIIAQLYLLLSDQPVHRVERVVGLVCQAAAVITLVLLISTMYSNSYATTLLVATRLNFAVAPSIAVLIFCMARYRTVLSCWASTSMMVRLGDASYEIYLIHIPVFAVVTKLAHRLVGGSYGQWSSVIAFALGLAALMAVSIGLHRLFEVPVRRWLRGLWSGARIYRFNLEGRHLAVGILCMPFLAAFLVAAAVRLTLPTLADDGGIGVISATLGRNCGGEVGNASRLLTKVCDGRPSCTYALDGKDLNLAAASCVADYDIAYQCAAAPVVQRASGRLDKLHSPDIHLSCEHASSQLAQRRPGRGISVLSATYGASCGAREGNATTDLRKTCDGYMNCGYRVDVAKLGDPAPGCFKNFRAAYRCGDRPTRSEVFIPAEAGLGSYALLACPQDVEMPAR